MAKHGAHRGITRTRLVAVVSGMAAIGALAFFGTATDAVAAPAAHRAITASHDRPSKPAKAANHHGSAIQDAKQHGTHSSNGHTAAGHAAAGHSAHKAAQSAAKHTTKVAKSHGAGSRKGTVVETGYNPAGKQTGHGHTLPGTSTVAAAVTVANNTAANAASKASKVVGSNKGRHVGATKGAGSHASAPTPQLPSPAPTGQTPSVAGSATLVSAGSAGQGSVASGSSAAIPGTSSAKAPSAEPASASGKAAAPAERIAEPGFLQPIRIGLLGAASSGVIGGVLAGLVLIGGLLLVVGMTTRRAGKRSA